MTKIIFIVAAFFIANIAHAKDNFCAGEVKAKATKLLALHNEVDETEAAESVDNEVIERPSIKSPDGKRKYVVLETTANVGKMGQYRIRLIYAILGNTNPSQDCILMGQEILDMSSL